MLSQSWDFLNGWFHHQAGNRQFTVEEKSASIGCLASNLRTRECKACWIADAEEWRQNMTRKLITARQSILKKIV